MLRVNAAAREGAVDHAAVARADADVGDALVVAIREVQEVAGGVLGGFSGGAGGSRAPCRGGELSVVSGP